MTRTHTARHPRPCASWRTPIRRGQVYRSASIPPRSHDILYSEVWIHLSDHLAAQVAALTERAT